MMINHTRRVWIGTKNIFFSHAKPGQTLGEMTPEYMYSDNVPQRLLDSLGPDIKLIVMLRNPVDRAFSQYQMSQRRGIENLSFECAIELESERVSKSLFNKHHFGYMSRSLYSSQLERLTDFFPIENIFVIIFEEDFLINRKMTIDNLLLFLGVSSLDLQLDMISNPARKAIFPYINRLLNTHSFIKRILRKLILNKKIKNKIYSFLERVNSSSSPMEKLSDIERNRLFKKYFLNDVNKVEKIIDRDLTIWKGNPLEK